MLTILTGGPGCGKSAWLLERIGERCRKGLSSLLLVPESGSHQAERRLLEVCGNRGGALAQVTTFSKLTEDVLSLTGCRPATLDPGGRVLTMCLALSKVQSSLEYYRRAGRPQLTEKLVEAVSELQTCGVLPRQLLEVPGLSPKLRDLGLIYAQYQALCQGGQLDPSARIELAEERLEQSGLLADTAVFVDGFEGFTAQKRSFLTRMLQCCREMTVALLLGEDQSLYTEQRRTKSRLIRMAEQVGTACQSLACPVVPRDRPAPLEGLAQRLYDFTAQPGDGGPGLALFTLADPAEECELAAGLMRQRALEGVRCREMAVVCGDLEEYGPALTAAFAKYEVPLYLSQKTDLLQKPALAMALGGLNALEDGLSFSGVIGWLRTGVGRFSRDELDRLENYCFQWNISGTGWKKPFTAPTCGYGTPASNEGERLAGVEQSRQKAAALLASLQDRMAGCQEGRAYADALAGHLEEIGLEDLLEENCRRLRSQNRGREAAETAQLYQILQEGLAQFSAVMEGVPMDRQEFCRLLKLTLRQYDVSAIPPSLDSVQAVTFERLPAQKLRVMVMIGGREGLFPPEKASQSLLSENDRAALELEGIELTQNALERVWQQQSALCRAAAAPQEQLTVTAPRRLADGTPCAPSYVLERMAFLTGGSLKDGGALLEKLRLTAPKPLFQLACSAVEGGGSGPARAALDLALEDPEKRAYLEKLRDYAAAPRGPLGDRNLVTALYGGTIRLTATRLDRVSSCRMSHFLQYGLKLQPRRQARFGPPEIGTFLHYVAEKSIPELCQNPTASPEAVAVKHINQYLDDCLPRRQEKRWQALFHQAGRLACLVVKNIWEEIQAGDFRPVCFELDFGKKGQLPPLTLREGSVTLTVGGKVDRVDGYVRGDTLYLKVADYKTGTKTFHLSDLLYGLNLQMFLYLMMLTQAGTEQVLRLTGEKARRIAPCGALYIPAKAPFVQAKPGDGPEELQKALDKQLRRIGLVLEDGDLLEAMERGGSFRFLPVERKKDSGFTAASCVATTAQLGRLLRSVEQSLRKIARQIAQGDIEATPYRAGQEDTPCRFCDYREACHFDPTLKKDKYRFLPVKSPAQVHEILEQAQQTGGQGKEDLG